MKVYYRSVREEIDKLINDAHAQNRTISFIELTEQEWLELSAEFPPFRGARKPATGEMSYRYAGKYADVALR